jgi:hypothetical protein
MDLVAGGATSGTARAIGAQRRKLILTIHDKPRIVNAGWTIAAPATYTCQGSRVVGIRKMRTRASRSKGCIAGTVLPALEIFNDLRGGERRYDTAAQT